MLDQTLITLILLPTLALLATLFCVPFFCKIALSMGFVDSPDKERKTHERPVPPVGGLAIFCVFFISSLFVESSFENEWAFFAALILILIAGVFDDKNGLKPNFKFLIHFLCAILLVVGGGAQITNLGDLFGFGDVTLGWFGTLFSIACVVYIINAMNMMDGLDGLCGGKALIIFAWLFVGASLAGWWEPAILLLTLIACLLGFLFFNFRHKGRRKAIVFLGDAGSMALGVTISWFAIHLSQGSNPVFTPISIAWIIALPIIDAFGLLVARLLEGKHPFTPDRRHFHHHFIDNGVDVKKTVRIILSLGFILGAFGFFAPLWGVPLFVMGWAWVALWLIHAALVMNPKPLQNLIRKYITPKI